MTIEWLAWFFPSSFLTVLGELNWLLRKCSFIYLHFTHTLGPLHMYIQFVQWINHYPVSAIKDIINYSMKMQWYFWVIKMKLMVNMQIFLLPLKCKQFTSFGNTAGTAPHIFHLCHEFPNLSALRTTKFQNYAKHYLRSTNRFKWVVLSLIFTYPAD